MPKRTYKALIIDLDGTTIPNKPEGVPSSAVVKTIHKAHIYVSVSVATGRPYFMCKHIIDMLGITAPCIVNGGAQIVDPTSGNVLHAQLLDVDTINRAIEICLPFGYGMVNSEEVNSSLTAPDTTVETSLVCVFAVKSHDADVIIEQLSTIDCIASHAVNSWTHGHVDIHITHKDATKRHAIEKLLAMQGLEAQDVIGVGDSNNDLPLLQSVGLKVAMGNASGLLKSHADVIVSSVDDDGLCEVIERYIIV